MEYAYYPGCSLHVMSSEYDVSTRAVLARLGVTLREIPDWFCCGASSAHMTDAVLTDALPAKNLALAVKVNQRIAVPCAACLHRLKKTDHKLKNDDALLKNVNESIKDNYQGNAQIKHPLEIIQDDLKTEELSEKITRPLNNLKVACYYGCLLVRPAEAAIDDAENPERLDRLMNLLGAETINWGFKVECCGAGMTLAHKESIIGLAGRILNDAILNEADCIAVACPMCHTNLDLYQDQMDLKRKVPILYFTELLGLALGLDYNSLEIDKHIVPAKGMLLEKGLV